MWLIQRKWGEYHPPIHIALLNLLLCINATWGYLLIVPDSTPVGSIVFNATLPRLGRSRIYSLHVHKNADFVRKLLSVNETSGQVSIRRELDCRGIWYPNLFTLHVESMLKLDKTKSKRRKIRDAFDWEAIALRDGRVKRRKYVAGVQYYAMALRIFITGEQCERDEEERLRISEKLIEAKRWVSESYASFEMPSESEFTKICLKQSQLINGVSGFLPNSLLSESCSIRYITVDDPRFEIESTAGDLVSALDQCILEPSWKVSIRMEVICLLENPLEHNLIIVYHHEHLNDTDIARRVRRELKNQSPYFEKALYIANVVEEKPSGLLVATLKARDPENSQVSYSMTSLLDSRSQSMFAIDESSGTVTTLLRLDRELMDVHYFRVSATDGSFPPRSGTTTLQINVIDANDHAPVFEKTLYETSVLEAASVGTAIQTVRATDKDVNRNADLEYSFDPPVEEFHIDGKSGVITTRKVLDRETHSSYVLGIVARDSATPASERRSASATLNVRVMDDNDNYPQFTEKSYSVTVREDVDFGVNPVIASVRATDADEGQNAMIRYTIVGGNVQSQFSVDSITGDVSLTKPLDFESTRSYRLGIRAQDGGSPSRSNTTQLLINVLDVNDNAPHFPSSLFQETVLESVPVNFSIIRVQAFDADEGANSAIKYALSSRDESGTSTSELPLRIDPLTGWIQTTKPLDREAQNKFQFQVIAEDGGEPPRTAFTHVLITVQDVNDNDPRFHPKIYEVVVSEQESPGTLVATVTASDADENPRLHYDITNGNIRARFAITSQNNVGLITLAQPLDYRQEKRFVLTVQATDSGGRVDVATVYINVSDANNYAPVFENAPYSAQVFEDAPVGTTVIVVQATDADVGQNAQITYTLSSNIDQAGDSFTINPQTGALTTTKALDRESASSYLLTLTARDGGMPSLSDTTEIEIVVQDVNDNAPEFSSASYQASIPEDSTVGTSVVQVHATDIDVGLNGRVRYTLTPPGVDTSNQDNSFAIDGSSGVIRTAKNLDRESVAHYSLTIYAVDRGTPALSSSAIVSIRIEDINDSPPAFESEKIVMYIQENSPIGSTVGELKARDPDEGINAVVQYSIIGGEDSSSFSLISRPDLDKAELITMVDLDYESPRKKFELLIRAASPPLRSDVRLEIMVIDINDNAPILKDFQVIFNNYRNCFPSGPIGMIPAFDADVSDQLHFRILSGNNAGLLQLNETSGEISLSSQLNTNVPKLASMDVSVTDGINEVKATMTLSVRLITEEMLLNSITVRLDDMTVQAFLSPLLGFFVDALAAVIPCPKENIYLFDVQDDTDVPRKVLNISFSARRPDLPGEVYFTSEYLQERVYLNRPILARLSTVRVLPFDDNLCLREPCLNFETCVTILKFGNASDFISSDSVLFRPIHPVTSFACRCPNGFTGSKEQYLCDREVDLCYSNPCQNNGTCHRKEGGYSCVCAEGFTGSECEIDLKTSACLATLCNKGICAAQQSGIACHCHGAELYAPASSVGVFSQRGVGLGTHAPLSESDFDQWCRLRARGFGRRSFLTFPALRQRYRLRVELRFATQSENGLLLYNGRYNEEHDFIAVEIINSNVQLSFSLGSNISRTTVSIPGGVSDGKWHSVTIQYFNKTGILSIDECDIPLALKRGPELGLKWACANKTEQLLPERCSLFSESCHRFFDLTGPLLIGGLPSLPTIFQITNKDFEGCISDLHIDNNFIDLNSFVADNGTHPGCLHKRNFCSSNPCKHNGKCIEGWGTYICECKDGHGGKDCSQGIKSSWRFRGDGVLSFNPLLRPIQLPWINSLSVRTLQKDAFLMSIQIGQNSSATMSLKNGLLHYSYNGESITLRQGVISDGVWHHLEAKWMSNEVWLSLDHGQREITQAFNAKVQGLYVGKILIGGPDSSYISLNSDFGYFEGCIQDVKVGSHQSLLQRPNVEENVSEGCSSQSACRDTQCPTHSDCQDQWERATCPCHRGYVTSRCTDVCQFEPCENEARCVKDTSQWKGYSCVCPSEVYSGEYCERKVEQPCPGGWWGYPVCGPCSCRTDLGYGPNCNKSTGECYCKEHHYQPSGSNECLSCDCYHVGSYHLDCHTETGQCPCRPGVIGHRCDSCSNKYAEVTLNGCEVVYDGCPRDFEDGLWWDRTLFNGETVTSCPAGTFGKASRRCDGEKAEWGKPDLFNCTSNQFMDLRKLLSQLENNELQVNTFVAVKVAADLFKALNSTHKLFGADVLITQQLLIRLLNYEQTVNGLNLTHSQDKDYISNVVFASSTILDYKYLAEWHRIQQLIGESYKELVSALEIFLHKLVSSQADTYTSPFEIISTNLILGLDVVSPSSLTGYEGSNRVTHSGGSEKVVIPDTSDFLHPPIQMGLQRKTESDNNPTVMFPKYNNYLLDPRNWDSFTKIFIPVQVLNVPLINPGEVSVPKNKPDHNAVFSYAIYKQVGLLYDETFDETVTKRWGIHLKVGSHLVSFALLVPSVTIERDDYGDEIEQVVTYKTVTKKELTSPVRLKMYLSNLIPPQRSNPQCVHWSSSKGGEWSRSGCLTEFPNEFKPSESFYVNCTCYQLGTFAVLLDQVDLEYIPDPTFFEDVVTYIGFSVSLIILWTTLMILSCIRGRPTNSNSVHKNIALCLFCGELIYFVALKLRRDLIIHEFACKIIAMFLHYFWLASFSWHLVDCIHLYRMLTELRDINHGQMRFYYCLGYGIPAIIVGLAVGVRAEQYGNFYFCWLSIYESVIWSLFGPVCFTVVFSLIMIASAVSAAFTLKDHVLAYGNLRTLIWVSLGTQLSILTVWVLVMIYVSGSNPYLPYGLAIALIYHSIFTLTGYCFLNARVRKNLYATLLLCFGREVPKELDASIDGIGSSSVHDRPNSAARSALAYRNTGVSVSVRRTLGISTSSTTSRSTAKTSSSPYRSDNQMRGTNTDTSTSNYNSGNEMRHRYGKHRKHSKEDDSDSENSVDGGRSLELASSHSSDDDVSSRHQSTLKGKKAPPSYLPNIQETAGSPPLPPSLNVMGQDDFFPTLSPLYAPRWSSQIPQTYLGDLREEQTSPQPLPHPGLSESYNENEPAYHVNLATVYEHEASNYNTENEEGEEKGPMTDKYLFPYTAEEDHCPPTLGIRSQITPNRDSPLYTGFIGVKMRESPHSFVSHRDSPTYGVRASPLLARGPHSPLLVSATNMELHANTEESEKDMSETPV